MKQISHYGFYDVTLFECPQFQMFTVNDCHRAVDILHHKKFEPMSMRLWCRLARNATAILDIGAQVGVYSLAAASLRKDIVIHAFEPNPFAYARLRVHKQLNRFNNIAEHCFAAGAEDAVAMLSWVRKPGQPISSGASLHVAPDAAKFESAPTVVIPIESLGIELGSHGLIKIDVEGFELGVMMGMGDMIESLPDIILESFDPRSCEAIWETLQPLGYRAYIIDEGAMRLIEQVGLHERHPEADANFNQFLTTRSTDEIVRLFNEAMP